TDPSLRKIYDGLRAGHDAELRTEAIRCTGCAAPLAADAVRCPFCGTPRPAEPAPPSAPPAPAPGDQPPAEPIDYYALLGLTPLLRMQPEPGARPLPQPLSAGPIRRLGDLSPRQAGPPKPADVDALALALQRDLLLAPGLTPAERDDRVAE